MDLIYKEDFDKTMERMDAYWRHEIIDRPCIQVTAPRDGAKPFPEDKVPDTLEARWLDLDYLVAKALHRAKNTFWGGEAVPFMDPNIGPDAFSAFLGCELEFAETTSWIKPVIDDWQTRKPFKLDPEDKWWKVAIEQTRTLAEVAKDGSFLVGIHDIHPGGDALSAMRTPGQLCLDTVMEPDEVKKAMSELTTVFFDIFEPLYVEATKYQEGLCTSWISVVSRGKYFPLQNDFSCLVGPDMFRDFFLDDIKAQADYLHNAVYHLDGPGAIIHVEALCSIESIAAIQWVPGAGAEPMSDWIDLLQKIQSLGKGLHVSAGFNEVPVLLKALKPEGLMIHTWTRTEEEARRMLKSATRKPRK